MEGNSRWRETMTVQPGDPVSDPVTQTSRQDGAKGLHPRCEPRPFLGALSKGHDVHQTGRRCQPEGGRQLGGWATWWFNSSFTTGVLPPRSRSGQRAHNPHGSSTHVRSRTGLVLHTQGSLLVTLARRRQHPPNTTIQQHVYCTEE